MRQRWRGEPELHDAAKVLRGFDAARRRGERKRRWRQYQWFWYEWLYHAVDRLHIFRQLIGRLRRNNYCDFYIPSPDQCRNNPNLRGQYRATRYDEFFVEL